MKILHIILSSYYNDGFNHQENLLSRQNKIDGHDVKIIASTFRLTNKNKIYYVEPSEYINEHNIPTKRIAYKNIINNKINNKLRIYKNTYSEISKYQPDIIFCHGVLMYELSTIISYKKKNPSVKVFFDSHADYNNSAKTIFSKNILHRLFYKTILKRNLAFMDVIYCVNYEGIEFLNTLYKIPLTKLKLFPLGGIIEQDEIRISTRNIIRSQLNLTEKDVLLVHSGKLNFLKRTDVLIEAFHKFKSNYFKLIIIGSITEELKNKISSLIENDPRITFLGWKSNDELIKYLNAGDLYIQPGSQSSTMQLSLCCGCPVAVYPNKSHKYLLKNNVFYIKEEIDIINLLEKIDNDSTILINMKVTSFDFAKKELDYASLVKIMYE